MNKFDQLYNKIISECRNIIKQDSVPYARCKSKISPEQQQARKQQNMKIALKELQQVCDEYQKAYNNDINKGGRLLSSVIDKIAYDHDLMDDNNNWLYDEIRINESLRKLYLRIKKIDQNFICRREYQRQVIGKPKLNVNAFKDGSKFQIPVKDLPDFSTYKFKNGIFL